MKIIIVAGARPNFMKIAPIVRQLDKWRGDFEFELVHTGQHYDHEMSSVFFSELGIPPPDLHMHPGAGTQAEQTGKIMVEFESYLRTARAELVMVVGDVNSTLACAIVSKKMGISVAHIEAGLRSRDMSMPEEINRIVTDSISDQFFVTEPSGVANLIKEGHEASTIHFVGHVMIDNLFFQMEKLHGMNRDSFPTNEIKANLSNYGVVTLHRPSNVDDKNALSEILDAISETSKTIPLIFPTHPRTLRNMEAFGLRLGGNVTCTPPLPYMEFLNLWSGARFVLTDSGGLQEETTALGVPCITVRDNTERPITITAGTNILAGTTKNGILTAVAGVMRENAQRESRRPEMWDGKAAERICAILRGSSVPN